MPATSIDTFFACTIILAAALISTAYLTSTMQTSIDSTQNINKEPYLKAIADRIIKVLESLLTGEATTLFLSDFGLSTSGSIIPYYLDANKITRLNQLNINSLSYFDMEVSSKLNNIAWGSLSPKSYPLTSSNQVTAH